MRAFLAQLLTDSEGRSDELAILAILGVLTFIGLEIFTVVIRHQLFAPEQFGVGLGSTLAATSVGMGIKSRCGG